MSHSPVEEIRRVLVSRKTFTDTRQRCIGNSFEQVEDVSLIRKPDGWHVILVELKGVEDYSVAPAQFRSVGCRPTVGHFAAGGYEGLRTETESEICSIVVRRPEEDRFQFFGNIDNR